MLFGRLADIVPENDSPLMLPMLLAHNFVEVCVIIVFSILFGAMMADVVEDSAVDTTRRRKGLFLPPAVSPEKWFPASAFFGRGYFVGGQFAARCGTEDVDEQVLVDLVLYAAPGQILLYSLALLMITRYRISRKKHNENITQLSVS